MDEKKLVFVSCGQVTDQEKELGNTLVRLVEELPGVKAFFAQNVESLDGLSENIFDAIKRSSAFIAIMHRRGTVKGRPADPERTRASVWIEQEIAIAAFLRRTSGVDLPVATYIQRGISLEGVREKLILNPFQFDSEDQIVADLRAKIKGWDLKAPAMGPNVTLTIEQENKETAPSRHLYCLKVMMKNTGTTVITDFIARADFPAPFVEPGTRILMEDREAATAEYRVFKHENFDKKPLLPGDTRRILTVPYRMDDALHRSSPATFDLPVKVAVYSDSKLAGSASRPFRELENF